MLLWRHTLAAARDLALKALTLDEAWHSATRSWTELAFGLEDQGRTPPAICCGAPTAQVVIPGAGMRIRGSIDRVDFNSAHNRVRVSDYKTGAEPPKASEIIIGRGAELQRVLYALAARQLVADNPQVVARLVFLGADRPKPYVFLMSIRRSPTSAGMSARLSISCAAVSPCPVLTHVKTGTTSRWLCRRRRPSIFRANKRHSVAPSATSRGFGTCDDEAPRRT